MPGEQSLTADNPLDRERSHLAASRSALRAMRADVEALDIRDVTANWVNAEVLQSEIDARIKALADLVHTPLFFGRLDYEEGRPSAARTWATASTSAAATSTTRTATPWSSTGARRSPSPSTGPPAPTRRTSRCAAASATRAVS